MSAYLTGKHKTGPGPAYEKQNTSPFEGCNTEQPDQMPPSPLLRLPQPIRLLIYTHAGMLVTPDQCKFINLNNAGAPNRNRDRQRFITTHRLLMTCHQVSEEVAAYIYASNHFFIRYNDFGNLETLRRLRLCSLRALRYLTIHLNVASCGLGMPCERSLDPWEEPDFDRHDTPFRANQSSAAQVGACECLVLEESG